MFKRVVELQAAMTAASLRSADAGIECCELMLTGLPHELDEATAKFFESQRQVHAIGYRLYRELTNAA
ncbi:MAG TPA: hypothetical protein VIY48_11290 [Candidatus Paceibacterota bacterium]